MKPLQSLRIRRLSFTRLMIALLLLLGLDWAVRKLLLLPEGLGRDFRSITTFASLILIGWYVIQSISENMTLSGRLASTCNHLLRSRLGLRSSRAPDAYIRQLFDDYAENFESHLVTVLHYQVPELLHKALHTELKGADGLDILDLGCGTGLCAPLFKPMAKRLVGIDLSPKMLAEAEKRGLYDHLLQGSLIHIDRHCSSPFDLIIAADVLIYFGDLDDVFRAVSQTLKPRGIFAFSLESTLQEPWVLNHNGRYAHARAYVLELARTSGLVSVRTETHPQRLEADEPVMGDLYLFRKGDDSSLVRRRLAGDSTVGPAQ